MYGTQQKKKKQKIGRRMCATRWRLSSLLVSLFGFNISSCYDTNNVHAGWVVLIKIQKKPTSISLIYLNSINLSAFILFYLESIKSEWEWQSQK